MQHINNEGEVPSNENRGQLPTRVRIYTEVTPQRADEIRRGIYVASMPVKHRISRWYAEAVLDFYEPRELIDKGLSRWQPIFASPIPHQGHDPLPDTILLPLDVDPSSAYVAEGDDITAMMNVMVGIKLMEAFGSLGGPITRDEFNDKFNAVDEDKRKALISMSEDLAREYWDSVIPYGEYDNKSEKYYEPEILLLPNTEIQLIDVA